jgi:predicted NAD/FAD-dependent oxidoreductase
MKFTHSKSVDRPLINSVVLTNVAPSYASDGRVLISSSAVGVMNDKESEVRVRNHLTTLFGTSAQKWQPVATYAIAHALPAILPPHKKLDARGGDGVYVAGDYRRGASINAAMQSGRIAAEAVASDLR